MAVDLTNPVKKDEWAKSAGYAGWNDYAGNGGTEALAQQGITKPNQGGGNGGTSLPSVDDYIKAITDTLPAAPKPYEEVNPFYFDEQNAQDLATAEYSPYYKELIDNYMTDVNTQKDRLGNDNTKILNDLNQQKDYFVQNNGDKLDQAIRGIKEGYEGSGLYFSGNNQRDVNQTQADYQGNLNDYLRQYGMNTSNQQTSTQRQLQDITTAGQRYTTEQNRAQQSAIAGQVQTQKGEAMDEYLIGAQKYYENPNWSSLTPSSSTTTA